jgi:hypothetical protein
VSFADNRSLKEVDEDGRLMSLSLKLGSLAYALRSSINSNTKQPFDSILYNVICQELQMFLRGHLSITKGER